MPGRFLASRRTGFSLRAVQTGKVGPGDALELIQQDPLQITVAELTERYLARDIDLTWLRRVLDLSALPEGWRDECRDRFRVGSATRAARRSRGQNRSPPDET
jgi:MOSC domain-containing protein YiiM